MASRCSWGSYLPCGLESTSGERSRASIAKAAIRHLLSCCKLGIVQTERWAEPAKNIPQLFYPVSVRQMNETDQALYKLATASAHALIASPGKK